MVQKSAAGGFAVIGCGRGEVDGMDGDFCLAVSIKSILSKGGVFFMKPGIIGSRTIRHFDLFL
jgi:hypothetical protein